MAQAHINAISTAVPPNDVHAAFVEFAPQLLSSQQDRKLFARMAARAQIDHRYSFLNGIQFGDRDGGGDGFYRQGQFPTTAARMQRYQADALTLARQAIDPLIAADATLLQAITHVIVTSCTGFYAPGLDFDIIRHYGLRDTVERIIVGFMGCNAAINALKLAHHIVRSTAAATVLIVNLELCTLHLQDADSLEQVLSFLIFGDGCAASIISAAPRGIAIEGFHSALIPDSASLITWQIGLQGFDMALSGTVPAKIAQALPAMLDDMAGGLPPAAIRHWAVHPGGRSILDAVAGIGIGDRLDAAREILRRYGNMSSATVMFVLKEILAAAEPGAGIALAFGPGVSAESMRFTVTAEPGGHNA